MSNDGCKDLANAMRALAKITDPVLRDKTINDIKSIQCVSCQQQVSFDNLIAGGSIDIGNVTQIQSCGIGNSGSEEMAALLNKYIDQSSKELKDEFNKNIARRSNQINNNITEVHTSISFDIKKTIQIFGVIAGVLFVLVLILIVMKIIKL